MVAGQKCGIYGFIARAPLPTIVQTTGLELGVGNEIVLSRWRSGSLPGPALSRVSPCYRPKRGSSASAPAPWVGHTALRRALVASALAMLSTVGLDVFPGRRWLTDLR